jgi:hypothetical protein
MNKDNQSRNQPGSGSAENQGRGRDEQLNQKASTSNEDRQSVARDTGLEEDQITDIEELGGLSGRDDASGGFNDGMDQQSTGEATDRQ